MIDVEPLIEQSFARLWPEPQLEPDWAGVLAGAGVRPRRMRRRLAVAVALAPALAAVLAATPLGATLAHALWSFPAWLHGHPGTPASSQAQQAFERENARSWAAFPKGTQLRRLISTDKAGVHYALYGFRSGDQLCLRLVVGGAATGKATGCAPLSDLRSRPAPALAIQVDDGFGIVPGKHVRIAGERYTVARAGASFGIVTDSVQSVTLRSDEATRHALVANNAFLLTVSEPKTGARVQQITAQTKNGRSYRVPFAQAPFDMGGNVTAPNGTLHGPAKVDRILHTGTIAWLTRRQPRGEPLPAGFPDPMGGVHGSIVYGRLLQPDPQSPLKVAITLYRVTSAPSYTHTTPGLYVCNDLVEGRAAGGGCNPLTAAFQRWPFSMGLSTMLGGDQYSVLSGLASDQVATLRLFLGDGGIAPVPLRNNAFAIRVSRARFPIRLVAYDKDHRVIGIQSMQGEGATPNWQKPDPKAAWKPLLRIVDADGHPATLSVSRLLAGTTCFRLHSANAGASGCKPPHWLGTPLQVGLAGDPRFTAVLEGTVRSDISRVVIRYRSGRTVTLTPKQGFILAPVPHHDTLTEVDAYTSTGKRIATYRPNR